MKMQQIIFQELNDSQARTLSQENLHEKMSAELEKWYKADCKFCRSSCDNHVSLVEHTRYNIMYSC